MSTDLRIATMADIDAIVALVNLAFRVEEVFVTGDRTHTAEVREKMHTGHFLLAQDFGGRLTGCVYVRATAPRSYFGMLAVHPDHEGHGLGRSLIDAAEARCLAAGCDVMEMSVVSVMEHLVAWYLRLGYEAYGTEPYAEPERELKMPVHFILMARPLRGAARRAQTAEAIA